MMPSHKPSLQQRQMAERMAGLGMTVSAIGHVFDIDYKTVRRHYAAETDRGWRWYHSKQLSRALDDIERGVNPCGPVAFAGPSARRSEGSTGAPFLLSKDKNNAES